MRLRHIEVFNAIYTIGSVSGAAKFLNVTQPTASKVLSHAESQLGYQLFRRIRGRLLPTEEAEILYRETKYISDRVTSLQKTARNLRDADHGHIKLSSISALGLEHLPRAILQFQKKYPDIHFEFQTHQYDKVISSILEQEKDIGVVFNAQNQRSLDFVNLGTAEFVCVYSGNEFDDGPERIKISDLSHKPFISIENSGPLGDLMTKMLFDADVILQTSITAQTYFVALNLAAMGGGVAIVDEFTATSQGAGKVKYKSFDPPIQFSVHAIHKDTKPPSKITRKFLNFLKSGMLKNIKAI